MRDQVLPGDDAMLVIAGFGVSAPEFSRFVAKSLMCAMSLAYPVAMFNREPVAIQPGIAGELPTIAWSR